MWYQINEPEKIISPSLLFYKKRIENNIDRMIHMAGSADRLVPHIKTHKCSEVVQIQLNKGINKFKCATIAEAEMLAHAGAQWILIAYQMVGPNLKRLGELKSKFTNVTFSSLVDNEQSADDLQQLAKSNDSDFNVFIDINVGMNRTGASTDFSLLSLFRYLENLPNIKVTGAHIYDGHIRNEAFAERKLAVDDAFEKTLPLLDLLNQKHGTKPMVIAGGSPTFTIHNMRADIFLSPGTNVLWDWGYGATLQDQPFLHAALILTRVISRPASGIITIDLGHKAIAAENPIDKRFQILNLTKYTVISQSEEHGVVQVEEQEWTNIQIGDLFYALPYHICPTVALHDFATVIDDTHVFAEWKITARNRRITI